MATPGTPPSAETAGPAQERAPRPKAAGAEDAPCVVETVRPGDSTHYPQRGDSVRVHYEGFLASDGTRFDSSRARDRPLTFKIGEKQVIPGWEEAVPQLSRGQIAKVHIPASKAYGVTGYPPIIPPESDLVFEIELLSFTS